MILIICNTVNAQTYVPIHNAQAIDYIWTPKSFFLPFGTIPSLNGTTKIQPGALFYNTSDSTLYSWSGTQWRIAGGGGGLSSITKVGKGLLARTYIETGAPTDSLLNVNPDSVYMNGTGDSLIVHYPWPNERRMAFLTGGGGHQYRFALNYDSAKLILRDITTSTNVDSVGFIGSGGSSGGGGGGSGILHAIAGTGLLQFNDSTIYNKIRDTATGGYYPYGRLGVGVLNPAYKLDVKGDINVSADSAYKYNGVNVIRAKTSLNDYHFANSGNLTMSGSYNISFAQQALNSNTTGSSNVAIGFQGIYNNTIGSENLGIGTFAGYNNQEGSYNVFLGSSTGGSSTKSSGGTYVGRSAGNSLNLSTAATTNNTFIGYFAGDGVTTGINNTIIGAGSTATVANVSNSIIITDGLSVQKITSNSAGVGSFYKGADVASASTITATGNLFHVTGTTNITSVSGTLITPGSTIKIIFDGALTFTDGSNLKLAGNFVTTADDTITLEYDGTNFYETARSVN